MKLHKDVLESNQQRMVEEMEAQGQGRMHAQEEDVYGQDEERSNKEALSIPPPPPPPGGSTREVKRDQRGSDVHNLTSTIEHNLSSSIEEPPQPRPQSSLKTEGRPTLHSDPPLSNIQSSSSTQPPPSKKPKVENPFDSFDKEKFSLEMASTASNVILKHTKKKKKAKAPDRMVSTNFVKMNLKRGWKSKKKNVPKWGDKSGGKE